MTEHILSFTVGFLNGILFLIVLWNTIDPFAWTPENTPSDICVHLNFKKTKNVVQATIFRPIGRAFPRSGPGYTTQFIGVEGDPIEPVYERHWGWVQVIFPEETDAKSD